MKRTFILLLIIFTTAAGYIGWRVGARLSQKPSTSEDRKVLFYQSPMHPWIKSDRPGNCTIRGMKLVPVYEGDSSPDASTSLITLSPQSATVIHVESAPVTVQPLRRTIHVAGMIDDDDSTHRRLSAYIDGRIDKLHVNFVGAEVGKGQPLVSIFSRDLLVARSEYTLAMKMSPGPDREMAIGGSRQKLRRMGLTLEQIEKLPGQTGDTFEIVAPIAGTVVERKVYEGQYVKEGEVLFEIADFDKMWFVFDAYERDLAWIKMGQIVEVTTASVPGKVFKAPISFIDPNVVMETRTAKVRVVLENPHVGDPGKHRHELLHKVFAEGVIPAETQPVLTVPRSAVLAGGTSPQVYVVKGEGHYEPRRVRLGRSGDDVWEVLDGLSEGERVVTTGNLLIDAQAQLEKGNVEDVAPVALNLTDAQLQAATELFAATDAASTALASDDLASYNSATVRIREGLAGWVGKLGVHATGLDGLNTAQDLSSARKEFHAFSTTVTTLAAKTRNQNAALGDVKIYECPMVKTAVPSAANPKGRWLQLKAPLRNPYFGAAMLDCGEEVRP